MLPIGRAPGVPTEGSRLVTVSSGGLRSLTRPPSHEGPTRQSAPNLDGGAGQERTSYASIQLGLYSYGPSRARARDPSNLGVRPPGFPRGRNGGGRVFCGARTLRAPPARTLLAPLGASTFPVLTCVSYLARTARTLSGPRGRMRARYALARARERKVTRLRVCSDVSQQGSPIAVDGHDVQQPPPENHRHAEDESCSCSELHGCSLFPTGPVAG